MIFEGYKLLSYQHCHFRNKIFIDARGGGFGQIFWIFKGYTNAEITLMPVST